MKHAVMSGLAVLAWVLPAAAGEPVPGDYGAKGGWGQLTIVNDRDGQRRFTLETTGANAHVCHLQGRLERERAILDDAGGGACEVSMAASRNRVEVRSTGEGCRYYCGMRAAFDGDYVRMRKDCLPQARERRSAAFLAEYRARRYASALEHLENTARECGEFFGWAEKDAFANDKAITLYHLGRYAQCLDVLEDTRVGEARDEVSLDQELTLPPTDRETYLPIARSTWHNRALCEKAAARRRRD